MIASDVTRVLAPTLCSKNVSGAHACACCGDQQTSMATVTDFSGLPIAFFCQGRVLVAAGQPPHRLALVSDFPPPDFRLVVAAHDSSDSSESSLLQGFRLTPDAKLGPDGEHEGAREMERERRERERERKRERERERDYSSPNKACLGGVLTEIL